MPVARYNTAAWQRYDEDSVVLIGREVEAPGEHGQPDKGKLVLSEMDLEGNIIHERVIWEPKYKNIYLEDPRALLLRNNTIIIGLSAVLKNDEGIWEPFPALVKIGAEEPWREDLPPVTLIQTFGPGKNLTPVDDHTFLFRPEDPLYYHKLLVFSFRKNTPEKLQDIAFPKNLPWARWRVGTAMPPLWINDDEAILIIHGINKIKGKYIYSIGRAVFSKAKGKYKIKVAPDAIITPETFVTSEGKSLVDELHDNRRVVYACGGIVKRHKKDMLYLYVNVGDRTTFEVGLPMDQLKEGLFEK
jgi:hypothetical protein